MSEAVLAGCRVAVTRTCVQASGLVDRLVGLGADVVELPVIAIDGPRDGGAGLTRAAQRLAGGSYEWVVVTSSNAVERLVAALDDHPVPPSVRWAAVGSGTSSALARAGFTAALVPTVAISGELAATFPEPEPGPGPGLTDPGPSGGGAVLFPRAETVRGALAEGLRAKGWVVDDVIAYRTVAGEPGPEAVEAAQGCDAIAFTSSSTVTRTLDLMEADRVPPTVVTIGPVTSETARRAGLTVAAEADPHTLDGLVAALIRACAEEPGRASQRQQQRQQQQ